MTLDKTVDFEWINVFFNSGLMKSKFDKQGGHDIEIVFFSSEPNVSLEGF